MSRLDEDGIKRKLKELWDTHHDFPALYVQAVLSGIPNPREVAREIAGIPTHKMSSERCGCW